jgi:hypothetical protein
MGSLANSSRAELAQPAQLTALLAADLYLEIDEKGFRMVAGLAAAAAAACR